MVHSHKRQQFLSHYLCTHNTQVMVAAGCGVRTLTAAVHSRTMDGVALASVITSGAVGLAAVGIAFWKDVKLAREKRLAESYLEVLRIVEREGQWIDAEITDRWSIAADEFLARERVMVPPPAVTLSGLATYYRRDRERAVRAGASHCGGPAAQSGRTEAPTG